MQFKLGSTQSNVKTRSVPELAARMPRVTEIAMRRCAVMLLSDAGRYTPEKP